MVPPRLTLVRTTGENDNAAPDSAGTGATERAPAASAPEDARAAAATALADLARSALVAADVVTGATAAAEAITPTDAPDVASTDVAATSAATELVAAEADRPVPSSGDAAEADRPLDVADPEAPPVAAPFASEPAGTPERAQALRILEALLFAASEPLDERRLAEGLGKSRGDTPIADLLAELQAAYKPRGVHLVRVAGKWALRTAEDLSWVLERHAFEERRLSKAALETLSIIAYHQPVTRAEIEDIRGVSTSAGTLDILLETGWVRPRGRRRAPGRPVTYGTTDAFLGHFGLDTIKDLPGLAELKGAGLLDATLPPGFSVPEPCDVAALMPDEMPLDSPDDEDSQAEMDLDTPEPPDDPPPPA